jgi:hypothetical protein
MKIPRQHFVPGNTGGRAAAKRGEDGMATVVFIALLAIMLILVTAESCALFNLHREVRLLEKQQLKRLNPPATNTVSTITSASE